jgi:hypothetical protein
VLGTLDARAVAAVAAGLVAVAVGPAVAPALRPLASGAVPASPSVVGIAYVASGASGVVAARTGSGRSLVGAAAATLAADLAVWALLALRGGTAEPASAVAGVRALFATVPALPLPLVAGAAAVGDRDGPLAVAVAAVALAAVASVPRSSGATSLVAHLLDPSAWGVAAVAVGLSAFLGGPLYVLGAAWVRDPDRESRDGPRPRSATR